MLESTMKRFILLLLLSGLLISVAPGQSTIFLVRHAEKAAAGGADPDLSEAGRARAESLATVLKDAGISVIFATELKRTQQTASPLSKSLRLDPVVIPANDSATLITRLRSTPANALVVGHGNTIPDLIKKLGITEPINIAENDYDNLFVVVLYDRPRLIRLHYR